MRMPTPCAFSAIAMGATMNAACILFAMSASLISGKPWNIRGMKSSPASENFEM